MNPGTPVTTRSDDLTPAAPTPADEPVAVPDRFGEYCVVRRIGQGGMGLVFEAEDPKLHRHVAVKVMRPAVAASPVARDRFLREARAAAAVSHDHVVPIFHVGEQDGVPFLVMPLLAGESLDDRLRRAGTLPVGEAVRVARELASGLAAAHAVGLIHRDVKPANVWLEDRGPGVPARARLLDFGLARSPTDDMLTQEGAIVGTPAYMSPEQARGRPVDARTDLYSLGAVLHRLLTGSVPDPAKSSPLSPDTPSDLGRLVQRLLEPDPANRPGSAAEVADELDLIAGRTTAGPRPRTFFVLMLLAPIVLCAGAVATIALWPDDRGSEPKLTDPPPVIPDQKSAADATPPGPQDRAAAEWVQRVGGDLLLSVDGGIRKVRRSEPLPVGPFRLRGVDLGRNPKVRGEDLRALHAATALELLWLDETVLGNDDLPHLVALSGLRELDLSETRVSSAGLHQLKALSRLEVLSLTGTGVDRLTSVRDLRTLTHLALDGTKVTDSDLNDLKGLPYLAELGLRSTAVTARGRKELQAELKHCEIRTGTWVHVSRFLQDRAPRIDLSGWSPADRTKAKG